MPFHRYVFILILFFATEANGQQSLTTSNLVGKTFVSGALEYLEILNDTTVYSSINSYTDTARFFLRNDTLFIKQKYLQTDQTGTKWRDELFDYKVITLSDDTVRLKNNYRFNYKPVNWEDTLCFVDIEKLNEPVANFKFLRIDFSSPWSGTRKITIDSSGGVRFIDSLIPYSINNPATDRNVKPKNIQGQLSKEEFSNFKELLSRSLPSRLPVMRGCRIDGGTSNIEITIGAKKIISTGCDLSRTHSFLLNYIYDIDQNRGLIKGAN